MGNCPSCGAQVSTKLVERILDPAQSESCPRFAEVKNPVVAAIKTLMVAIDAGYRESVTINTDDLRPMDDMDREAFDYFINEPA